MCHSSQPPLLTPDCLLQMIKQGYSAFCCATNDDEEIDVYGDSDEDGDEEGHIRLFPMHSLCLSEVNAKNNCLWFMEADNHSRSITKIYFFTQGSNSTKVAWQMFVMMKSRLSILKSSIDARVPVAVRSGCGRKWCLAVIIRNTCERPQRDTTMMGIQWRWVYVS